MANERQFGRILSLRSGTPQIFNKIERQQVRNSLYRSDRGRATERKDALRCKMKTSLNLM